jgi:hypothetical protein
MFNNNTLSKFIKLFAAVEKMYFDDLQKGNRGGLGINFLHIPSLKN